MSATMIAAQAMPTIENTPATAPVLLKKLLPPPPVPGPLRPEGFTIIVVIVTFRPLDSVVVISVVTLRGADEEDDFDAGGDVDPGRETGVVVGVLLDPDDGGVVELTVLVGSLVDDDGRGVELVVGDGGDDDDDDELVSEMLGAEDVRREDVVGEEVSLGEVELEVCTGDDEGDVDVEVEGVLELVLLISAEVKNGAK